MEELDDSFVPDFTHLATLGEVSDRNSQIRHVGEFVYISIGKKLNAWNVRFSELERSVPTLNKKITCFDFFDDLLVIGYENGAIQIHSDEIISFRPHSRRVTKVTKTGDYILSSSADGSIVLYDIIGGEIRVSYEGNDMCVEKFFSNSKVVIGVCADNALRVWDFEDKHIKSVHMFEKAIKDTFVVEEEAIIFFKDGECIFYSLEDKTMRPFNKFKKLRNIKVKENRVFLQSKNKLHIYEMSKKDKIAMRHQETIKASDRYADFDITSNGRLVFATIDNCWEYIEDGKVYSFGFHKNEILCLEVHEEKIITLSKECIIFWMLDGQAIKRIGNIQIKNGKCICVWNNCVVVGGNEGFSCYSISSYDLVREESIGPVSSVFSNTTELIIGKDNDILFYDSSFTVLRTLEVESPISSIEVSKDGSLLCVGLLNNKVHIYNMNGLDLKVTLYGHALPVRSMKLSPDNSEILTCGADKTVKMWGTQFGECRKSFIGDSRSVEYLSKDLFMFSSGGIQYFRRYEKLKEFKYHESSLVKIKKDLMISCGKFNIDLYSMNKYEFQKEDQEESDDEEVMKVAKIMNCKVYDRFLTDLEELSKDFSNDNIKTFFNTLMDIDFCELDRFFCLMSSSDVILVINALHECAHWNSVLAARVFISLLRLHKDICISHPNFKTFLCSITNRIEDIRCQASRNEAILLVRKAISSQKALDFE
ncbi:hypothetical protein KMI_06g11250 [Encephalitozoon hellem]|nr:hypothetical protein KMI_06g11250 [Encephalitozoon hellem]